MDQDPLQRWIYFLTFIESLEMIFSRYKENCEVLLYYKTIGGEDIKDYVRKEIMNLLHANIDVHSRRLISKLPVYGVKCTSKLQSNCANMTFSEKVDMIVFPSSYIWLTRRLEADRTASRVIFFLILSYPFKHFYAKWLVPPQKVYFF